MARQQAVNLRYVGSIPTPRAAFPEGDGRQRGSDPRVRGFDTFSGSCLVEALKRKTSFDYTLYGNAAKIYCRQTIKVQ